MEYKFNVKVDDEAKSVAASPSLGIPGTCMGTLPATYGGQLHPIIFVTTRSIRFFRFFRN
jgi:hypothetical protein